METRPREVKVTKFQHAYPTIRLPFQEVQRVAFGHREHFLSSILWQMSASAIPPRNLRSYLNGLSRPAAQKIDS